jgi:hypothetical protein
MKGLIMKNSSKTGTAIQAVGGLVTRFLACDPNARPMPLDASNCDTPRTLPTDVAQPYEAAVFAATNRYRLSANEDPDEIEVTPDARRLFLEDWNPGSAQTCSSTTGREFL